MRVSTLRSNRQIRALIESGARVALDAFVIYFRLVQTLGSVGTTSQAYLRVPIGVMIGVLALGESLGSSAWIGLLFVVAGVAAMTIPARAPALR